MARGVYDIDFRAVIVHGSVFRENGDASFSFEIVAVPNAFLNDFGDVTSVCTNGTGIVLSETNATVSIPDKYYYGSAYSVYFEDSPFLDMNNVSIPLPKGAYSFTINSPRFS